MRCVVGNIVDPGLGARIGRRGIRFEPSFLLWWRYRGCRGHGGRRWIRYGRIRFNLIHQLIGSPPCSPRVILSQLLVAPFFDAFKQFFVGCVGVTELHAFEKAFNMNQRLRRTNSLRRRKVDVAIEGLAHEQMVHYACKSGTVSSIGVVRYMIFTRGC